VRLQQTLNGIPIDGALSTVSMQPGASAPSFVSDRHAADAVTSVSSTPAITAPVAELIAGAAVGMAKRRGAPRAQLVYRPQGLSFVLAWDVTIGSLKPLGSWRVAVDAQSGAVLYRQSLQQDDTGQVFNPNPFQSSGGTIPPPTDCDTGAHATSLAGQITSASLLGITAAQNKLKGAYVDLTAPGIVGGYKTAGQANEASRIYNYPCNDDRFEEVMVYSYVDRTQRQIQSLGFTGTSSILNRPIAAHAHYFGGCNAFYDSYDGGIHFGDVNLASGSYPCPSAGNGADTAEDGDVIVHEYGHALQDNVVPSWGWGPTYASIEQAGGMGEGWGDFAAAIITNDPCVGGWGLLPWITAGQCLRDISVNKVYPADFNSCSVDGNGVHEVHCTGKIWGSALWNLVTALPGGNTQGNRDIVFKLALDSQFYLSPTATFNEWAAAIRQADVDIYAGAHGSTIGTVFTAHGITSTGAIGSTTYYSLRVIHPVTNTLTLTLKVGSNVNSPVCTELLWSPGGPSYVDVAGKIDISDSNCAAFFPPSVSVPWRLEAKDNTAGNSGWIDDFEVALSTSTRCLPSNLPIAIPDGTNSPVYGVVDCTNVVHALPTSTPTPTSTNTATNTPTPTRTPTPTATPTVNPTLDTDGDGYTDVQELALLPAENPNSYCAIMRADVNGSGSVSIGDLSLVAGYFGQSVPTAPARYDQNGTNTISIGDLSLMASHFGQNVSACPP
jgi:hypothetical protein